MVKNLPAIISLQLIKINEKKKKKESACRCRKHSSIPGLGRSPGEGNDRPFQSSYLGHPMDKGTWWVSGHGGLIRVRNDLVTKQQRTLVETNSVGFKTRRSSVEFCRNALS